MPEKLKEIYILFPCPRFVAPLIVAHFTKERVSSSYFVFFCGVIFLLYFTHQSTDAEWRYVFLIGAGMLIKKLNLIASALIFIVFGSGKVQKWNEISEETDQTKTEIGTPKTTE